MSSEDCCSSPDCTKEECAETNGKVLHLAENIAQAQKREGVQPMTPEFSKAQLEAYQKEMAQKQEMVLNQAVKRVALTVLSAINEQNIPCELSEYIQTITQMSIDIVTPKSLN